LTLAWGTAFELALPAVVSQWVPIRVPPVFSLKFLTQTQKFYYWFAGTHFFRLLSAMTSVSHSFRVLRAPPPTLFSGCAPMTRLQIPSTERTGLNSLQKLALCPSPGGRHPSIFAGLRRILRVILFSSILTSSLDLITTRIFVAFVYFQGAHIDFR